MRQTPDENTGEGAPSGVSPRAGPGHVARRRRGVMFWLGWGLGGLSLLLMAVTVGLWLRLNLGPMTLPETLRDRIEARLDAGMTQGRLSIGEMAIDLPEGGRAPVMEFRDVRLSDPDGAPRAAFPALRVQLDAGPILSGQVRPTRVEIAGAGLRLSRDAAGRFDLDLSGATGPARVTVPETMARLDTMFAAPVFDALQEVTATGLQLSMADAMTGQTMRIQDASARLTRREGQLTLTVGGALDGSRDSRVDIAILRRAAQAETEIAGVFRDLAARDLATVSPALAWLDLMRAPISGRLAFRLGDDGTVGDLEARLDIGEGRVLLGQDSAPLGFNRIGAEMVYDPDTRRLSFSALRLDAPELRFAAEGHADVAEGGTSFVSQFRLSGVEAHPEGMFDRPRVIEGAAVDLRLTLAPTLRIELAQATVFDGDLRARAEGLVEAREGGLAVALDLSVPELDAATVLSYWPETVLAGTRRWLAGQVEAATFAGVDFAWRSAPGGAPRRALQMSLDNLVLRPLRAGPPIRDGGGVLELDDNRLVLRLDAGTIAGAGGGPVDVAGSTMIVADTRVRGAEAAFDVQGRGALSDVLALLDGPPFSIFRDGDMTPERIGDGRVALSAEFRTRLERRETPATLAEMGLTARGVVTEFVSDTMVPDRALRADRLDVTLTPRSRHGRRGGGAFRDPPHGHMAPPAWPRCAADLGVGGACGARPAGACGDGRCAARVADGRAGRGRSAPRSARRRAGHAARDQRLRGDCAVRPGAWLATGTGGDRRAGGRDRVGAQRGGHGAHAGGAGASDGGERATLRPGGGGARPAERGAAARGHMARRGRCAGGSRGRRSARHRDRGGGGASRSTMRPRSTARRTRR